jgi:hypothetical protein
MHAQHVVVRTVHLEDHLADPKPLAILENSISSVAVRKIEEEA